jgi:hypothetical protein
MVHDMQGGKRSVRVLQNKRAILIKGQSVEKHKKKRGV